jgi:hypothetical protein
MTVVFTKDQSTTRKQPVGQILSHFRARNVHKGICPVNSPLNRLQNSIKARNQMNFRSEKRVDVALPCFRPKFTFYGLPRIAGWGLSQHKAGYAQEMRLRFSTNDA